MRQIVMKLKTTEGRFRRSGIILIVIFGDHARGNSSMMYMIKDLINHIPLGPYERFHKYFGFEFLYPHVTYRCIELSSIYQNTLKQYINCKDTSMTVNKKKWQLYITLYIQQYILIMY